MNKQKSILRQNFLEEAKILGYMEGFSDGRNSIIEEFIKFRLLHRGWKDIYNRRTKGNYIIK